MAPLFKSHRSLNRSSLQLATALQSLISWQLLKGGRRTSVWRETLPVIANARNPATSAGDDRVATVVRCATDVLLSA